MLQIKLTCPSCGTEHLVPSAFEGKKVTCANEGCGALISVVEPNPVHFEEAPATFHGQATFSPNEAGMSQQVRSHYGEVVIAKQAANQWSFLGRSLFLLGLFCLAVATLVPLNRATVEINIGPSLPQSSLILIAVSLLISGSLFWTAGKQSPGKLESRVIVLILGLIVAALGVQAGHRWFGSGLSFY